MPGTELDRCSTPFCRRLHQARSVLPKADGALDEPDEPVAMGWPTRSISARRISPASPIRAERRLVVRSLAFAVSQEQSLRQRVARAVTELNALDERQQGKPRLPDAAAAYQAASLPHIVLRGWATSP